MKIAVDAMGGDHAPEAIVAGAVDAVRRLNIQIFLVGPQAKVKAELARHNARELPIEVIDAPDIIEMHESPASALRRKRRASIVVVMELVRDGRADAVVSAGHTGAAMGAALLVLGRIPGVDRPPVALVVPTLQNTPVIVLDVGANVDCKPQHLQQFALLGTVYANRMLGIASPRVGVLSNGTEEGKGNELTITAAELLRTSPGLTFIGNVEARDILNSVADVVVCDGFVGNVAAKTAEGLWLTIRSTVKRELTGWRGLLLKLYLAPIAGRVRRMYRLLDYREFGGWPLLGINGVCFISHGSSDALTIRNAIRMAAKGVTLNYVDEIRTQLPTLNGAAAVLSARAAEVKTQESPHG